MNSRFLDVRNTLGLKIVDFAARLGVTPAFVTDVEKNRKEVSKKLIFSLYENFRVNPNWLILGEGEMFISPESEKKVLGYPKRPLGEVPVIDRASLPENSFLVPLLDQKLSAGAGAWLPDGDMIQGYIPTPPSLRRFGERIAAMYVSGDSMNPTLDDGDIIVCDSCGWSGEGIYCIQMNGEGFVKRLTQKPGAIVVLSDNPRYPSMEVSPDDENFKVVGKVHGVFKNI